MGRSKNSRKRANKKAKKIARMAAAPRQSRPRTVFSGALLFSVIVIAFVVGDRRQGHVEDAFEEATTMGNHGSLEAPPGATSDLAMVDVFDVKDDSIDTFGMMAEFRAEATSDERMLIVDKGEFSTDLPPVTTSQKTASTYERAEKAAAAMTMEELHTTTTMTAIAATDAHGALEGDPTSTIMSSDEQCSREAVKAAKSLETGVPINDPKVETVDEEVPDTQGNSLLETVPAEITVAAAAESLTAIPTVPNFSLASAAEAKSGAKERMAETSAVVVDDAVTAAVKTSAESLISADTENFAQDAMPASTLEIPSPDNAYSAETSPEQPDVEGLLIEVLSGTTTSSLDMVTPGIEAAGNAPGVLPSEEVQAASELRDNITPAEAAPSSEISTADVDPGRATTTPSFSVETLPTTAVEAVVATPENEADSDKTVARDSSHSLRHHDSEATSAEKEAAVTDVDVKTLPSAHDDTATEEQGSTVGTYAVGSESVASAVDGGAQMSHENTANDDPAIAAALSTEFPYLDACPASDLCDAPEEDVEETCTADDEVPALIPPSFENNIPDALTMEIDMAQELTYATPVNDDVSPSLPPRAKVHAIFAGYLGMPTPEVGEGKSETRTIPVDRIPATEGATGYQTKSPIVVTMTTTAGSDFLPDGMCLEAAADTQALSDVKMGDDAKGTVEGTSDHVVREQHAPPAYVVLDPMNGDQPDINAWGGTLSDDGQCWEEAVWEEFPAEIEERGRLDEKHKSGDSHYSGVADEKEEGSVKETLTEEARGAKMEVNSTEQGGTGDERDAHGGYNDAVKGGREANIGGISMDETVVSEATLDQPGLVSVQEDNGVAKEGEQQKSNIEAEQEEFTHEIVTLGNDIVSVCRAEMEGQDGNDDVCKVDCQQLAAEGDHEDKDAGRAWPGETGLSESTIDRFFTASVMLRRGSEDGGSIRLQQPNLDGEQGNSATGTSPDVLGASPDTHREAEPTLRGELQPPTIKGELRDSVGETSFDAGETSEGVIKRGHQAMVRGGHGGEDGEDAEREDSTVGGQHREHEGGASSENITVVSEALAGASQGGDGGENAKFDRQRPTIENDVQAIFPIEPTSSGNALSAEHRMTAAGDKVEGSIYRQQSIDGDTQVTGRSRLEIIGPVEALEGGVDVGERGGSVEGESPLHKIVQEFNAWVASLDFPVRKIEAAMVGGGMRLGAVAIEPLEEGEPYLSVPDAIVMDSLKARADPELGRALTKLGTSLFPEGLWDDNMDSLLVLLVAESFTRVEQSHWAPYLRLLPTPRDVKASHPLFFDDAKIELLEGSDVQAASRLFRDSEVAAFERKFGDASAGGRDLKAVLGEDWITLERYLWAMAILHGRAISWDGRKHLVPLLDLVNNDQGLPSTPPQETVLDSSGYAVTKATRSFDKKNQVFESYGYVNHVLFVYHGFSLGREHRRDCVRIDAERAPAGREHWEMLSRLQKTFPDGRPLFCISLSKHGRYDFVSYVRIMAGLPPSPPTTTTAAVSNNSSASLVGPDVAVDQKRVVHERWNNLHRDDPEGLRLVVEFLEARLKGYPRSSVRGGGGSGRMQCSGDREDSGACGGEDVGGSRNDVPEATSATSEQVIQVFLDSEQHILRELLEFLQGAVPPSLIPVDESNDSDTPERTRSSEEGTPHHGTNVDGANRMRQTLK